MLEAYSCLDQILRRQNVTVTDLHRRMKQKGVNANLKSLYRLANPQQRLERLDLRLAGEICQTFDVQLSDLISFQPPAAQLRTLARAKQRRLEQLMDENNEGTISPEGLDELTALVREAEELTLSNTRLLAEQQRRLNLAKPT